MNKRILVTTFAVLLSTSCIFGCGKSNNTNEIATTEETEQASSESNESVASSTSSSVSEVTESNIDNSEDANKVEDTYICELTGEPVSKDIQNQRPIAVMIDNEKAAYPHYGVADADIVYELMNSTANNRITRLMAVYKNYEDIKQIGSIRSVRPTNILLAQEMNAIICHDGGPFYINDYLSRYNDHFSGTFSRVNNGKNREFTEYILSGDMDKNFSNSKIDKNYDSQVESQFNFVEYGSKADLSNYSDSVVNVNEIDLPFAHTSSKLVYNKDTKKYDYYSYGSLHKDAETNKPLEFENVILQKCSFTQYDKNGYLIYNCIDANQLGWYITEGKAVPILWSKNRESAKTEFTDANGNEIKLNTGKTYITLVPDDGWDSMKLK